MDQSRIEEYKKTAVAVIRELDNNTQSIEQYKNYAVCMLKNRDSFMQARSKFNQRGLLHYYLTIGKTKEKDISFDIRYLGQSVGTIKIENDDVILSVTETQNKNSRKYFNYEMGTLAGVNWSNDEEAVLFREFFNKQCDGQPHQKEHLVESALFSELGKKSSRNKQLCNITPIAYEGTRIHMKTALKGSDKKKTSTYSTQGGEIDVLCRRIVRPGESRLVVIEVKDENKQDESFDLAMNQAITYAVFLWKLIHSEAGEYWMELFGMQNQKREGFSIDCVVAMPKGVTKPSFTGNKIELINENGVKEFLELHFIEMTKIDYEDVEFKTSLTEKCDTVISLVLYDHTLSLPFL